MREVIFEKDLSILNILTSPDEDEPDVRLSYREGFSELSDQENKYVQMYYNLKIYRPDSLA